MNKLCIVYNFAQLYRQPIFTLIENEWNCEWWFGYNTTDIKGMNTALLKNIHYVNNRKLIGSIVWQEGIGKLIRRKDLSHFLMLGEPYVLTTWWALIQRRLFHPHKKIYLWSHGWYGREGFIKKWLKRIFFGMADHVFTYGEYAKTIAISQGFKAHKITPIHNSLNHEYQVKLRQKLSPSNIYSDYFKNKYPVLIFVGRLTKIKRLDLLLHAIAKLKKQNLLFNIVLIGDGEEMEKLKDLSMNLDISNQVWFYGACYDDSRNAQLLYDADLCVAPGNVGLTAMHSMVFGTPVLTHNDFRWQMPEFESIHAECTGDFFEHDNINSLVDKITTWFDIHKNERERIRINCYYEIDNYWTPKYQLQQIKSVLENL